MFRQKNIISFLIVAFLLSSVWLFYFSSNNILDQNRGKNWWSLYFENPKSNELNFVIENHSNENNFHWIVSSGNSKLDEGDASIEKGALLNLNSPVPPEIDNKKIIIQVISGDTKKEIYKNL